MNKAASDRFAAVYGAAIVAQWMERRRQGRELDDNTMQCFVEDALILAKWAERAWGALEKELPGTTPDPADLASEDEVPCWTYYWRSEGQMTPCPKEQANYRHYDGEAGCMFQTRTPHEWSYPKTRDGADVEIGSALWHVFRALQEEKEP
jgi:hypothetical protein